MSATGDVTSFAGDVGLLAPVWAGSRAEQSTDDAALVRSLLRSEAALLRALAQAGLVPAAAAAVGEHVERLPIDVRTLAIEAVAGGNPVIPLVHRLRESVAAAFGDEAASWIHHGATSQDILDTALMLMATDVLDVLLGDLVDLADRLAGLAVRYREVPAVARTLAQQALPTTLGVRIAGWLIGTCEAIRAVRTLRPLPASLSGPVGSAHTYGAEGSAVLDAFAHSLGLSVPALAWHTRRGVMVGLTSSLVMVGGACGKVAADVIVMSQIEVGEVREANGGSSSSMTHKANPARSVLVASAARQLPALASVIGFSAVAEQERPAGAWHAEWQPLRTMLRLAGGAAALTRELVDALVIDESALARNVDQLREALGEDDAWLARHVSSADVWISRAIDSYRVEGGTA
jgi:3-carboxy-cis,cis-muconate cycloisomerase